MEFAHITKVHCTRTPNHFKKVGDAA
jgi:hypothetical protein